MSDALLTLLGQIAYEIEPYPPEVRSLLSLRIASLLVDSTVTEAHEELESTTVEKLSAVASELTQLADCLARDLECDLDTQLPGATGSG